MKLGFFISAIVATTLLATGCADEKMQLGQTLYNVNDFKISRRYNLLTPDAAPTIQVFNQANQPVPHAQIMIGETLGSPFKENLMTTDENGFVTVSDWTVPAHVTVNAVGYIRQTLLNQKPGALQIKLNTAYVNPRPVVKGQVTNIPVNNGDKFIDFALVIPTIAKADLVNFDLGMVISPYIDTVDIIFGQQADLPSNVSLPTQKESYALIPVTLSKPEHRVYALTYGPKTYYALTGRFPFKTVVGELQEGKMFYEIINHFNFTTGGLRETTITAPSTVLNIPGHEIKFSSQVGVKGAAVQADEVVMSLAMNDLSGGRFVPSDVKRLEPNKETKLNTIPGKATHIVSLLKKQTDFDQATADVSDRSSASMLAYAPGMQTSLLPLMMAPTVSTDNGAYKISIPQASNITSDAKVIHPLGVSVSISKITTIQDGPQTVEILDRQWEVLGTEWPSEIQLPAWPLDAKAQNNSTAKRKFEVNLIGSQTSQQTDLGDDMVKAVTHVTHAAAEL